MSKKLAVKKFGILTPIQKTFLEIFSELPDKAQFYLTGGIALAEYYLGHRLSFDLDFFTGVGDLILPVSYQVEALFQKKELNLHVVRRFSSFVQFLFENDTESLKIDPALDSHYRLAPIVEFPAGISVNNYTDLRVDKLLAHFGRAELSHRDGL